MIKLVDGIRIRFDTAFSEDIIEGIVLAYDDDCLVVRVGHENFLLDINSNDSFRDALKKNGLSFVDWIERYKIPRR